MWGSWQTTTRNSRPTDSHVTNAWPLDNFLPFVRDSSVQLWYRLLGHLVSNLRKESYKQLISVKDSQALIHSLLYRKPDSADTAHKTTLCQPWTCWCWLGAGNGLHGLLRSLPAFFSTPLQKERQEMGLFSSTTRDLPSSGFSGAKVQRKAVIPLGNAQGAGTRQTPSALSPWHHVFTDSGRCICTSMWS